MKKKVLSALLAVALFVGLAVPAFASSSSAQEATSDEVTALAAKKSEYTIRQNEKLELAKEIIAYAGTKKVCLSPDLTFELANDTADFALDDNGDVTALSKSGSATVIVKANEDKVTLKVTVKATTPFVDATGFKFASSTITVPAGGGDDQPATEFQIAPIPSNGRFTDAQIEQIDAILAKLEIKNGEDAYIAEGEAKLKRSDDKAVKDGENLVVAVADTTIKALGGDDTGALNKSLKGELKTAEDTPFTTGTTDKKVSVSATFKFVPIKNATKVAAPGTITLEVGQEYKLGDHLAFGPSNANNNKDVTCWEESIGDGESDYAIVDGTTIKAIAVGSNKIVTQLDVTGGNTTYTTVKVVAKGTLTKEEVSLSSTTATMAVGGTSYITVKGVDENAKVEWKIDNDNATIVAGTNGVKIFGKKVGTATVTCTVDGTEVGKIAVTVKAAETTEPTKPGATTNPQTGDSIFAGLF